MNDYRVTLKVRNNRILSAIEEVGGSPGPTWCDNNQMSYVVINGLINMKISPISIDGRLTQNAQYLCEATGKLPEELWSNEQLYPLQSNIGEIEMNRDQVAALIGGDSADYSPDSIIERMQRCDAIEKIMGCLKDRERKVIEMRIYDESTLNKCAESIGKSVQRARQIESKAIRKLIAKSKTLAGSKAFNEVL